MRLGRRCLTTSDLLPSKLVKTRFPLRFASVLMLTKHVLDLKYHKCRNKAIKILNTKIPTDPYKMAVFPVGIPYSLQKPKNPYRRDFSLRVAALVSLMPKFWCCLEVAATELHLCFVIKGNMWWKRTFLPMATIVVLHHKHMKLFKQFTPHVIAWSVRKGFNLSIRRTKEQKTRLQCLPSAMPKPVMPSGNQEL